MPVTVSARLSTDGSNGLSFGSDGGLFGVGGGGSAVRGGSPAWTIDNSWGSQTGVTYYYMLGTGSASTVTWPSATAFLYPFVVSRNAKITGVTMQVSTAATSTVYLASYASDSTGAIGNKIADVGNASAAATGGTNFTMTDTSTTYTANAVYWLCAWVNTAASYPTIYLRQIGGMGSLRLPSAPSGNTFFSGPLTASFLDTTSGWASRTAAPTTAAPTFTPAAMGNGSYTPAFAYGLANV